MSKSTSSSPRGLLSEKQKHLASEKQKRRANSCIPCRESKSKCEGGTPCSTCMRKRLKPRCIYRTTGGRDGDDPDNAESITGEQNKTDPLADSANIEPPATEAKHIVDEPVVFGPYDGFLGGFSLAQCLTVFKSLLALEESVNDIVSSIRTQHVFQITVSDDEAPSSADAPVHLKADAAMQTVNPFITMYGPESLPAQLQPVLLSLATVHQMLESGSPTAAWEAFGSLFRKAQIMGLHKEVDTTISEHERESRHRLWWQLLDLDAHLSFVLGQPLLISHDHGIPRPSLDGMSPSQQEFCRSKLDFTQYLCAKLEYIFDETLPAPDLEEYKTQLGLLIKQGQDLQPKPDSPLSVPIAEHQIRMQTFNLVLLCHRGRPLSSDPTASRGFRPGQGSTLTKPGGKGHSTTARPGRSRNLPKQPSSTHIRDICPSARSIAELYLNFSTSDPSRFGYRWTGAFSALCAATILGISHLHQDTKLETDVDRIQGVCQAFVDMSARFPSSALAQVGSSVLDTIIDGTRTMEPRKSEFESAAAGGNLRTSPAQSHIQPPVNQQDQHAIGHGKRPSAVSHGGDGQAQKRARYASTASGYDSHPQGRAPDYPPLNTQYQPTMSTYGNMAPAEYQEPSPNISFEQPPYQASSNNASFTSAEHGEYPGMGYGANQHSIVRTNPFSGYIHPPMLIQPPYYHFEWEHIDLIGPPDMTQASYYNDSTPVGMVGSHAAIDPVLQPGQTMAMNTMDGTALSTTEPALMGELRTMGLPRTGQLTPEHAGGAETQFYHTTPDNYPRPDQFLSSPTTGESSGRPDAMRPPPSARPGGLSRRPSAADIPQSSEAPWVYETPSNYGGDAKAKRQKAGTKSPPREGLVSPTDSEGMSTSRRSSITGRTTARPAPILPKQSDATFSEQDSSMAPMAERSDLTGLRRHSAAIGNETPFDSMAGHLGGMAQVAHGIHPPMVWHDSQDTAMYEYQAGMMNQPVDYNHTLARHQFQHPHHNIDPRPAVTTGAYTHPHGSQWWIDQ